MAVYHRTQRLQIYGEKPEVTQLFGDRYRMVVRCKAARDTEAWYNANKDQIFASFGTLYSAQMSVDGIDPRSGEAYPDMCLVSNGASYTQTGEYVISFVYETLTDTWTQEQGDQVSSTDNGLRLVERSEVAKITAVAPYDEDDVGVATITDGGKTLYLASFQDQTGADNDAQVGRVVTRWAEAGKIRERTTDIGDGRFQVQTTFIGVESATIGPVIDRNIDSVRGFQTISVTTLQDKDGNSIANGGENLIAQHDVEVDFTYPGEVSIGTDTGTLTIPFGGTNYTVNFTDYFYDTKPRVTNPIIADRYVFIQTSKDIVAGDYTYNSAIGRWKPNTWASGEINGVEALFNGGYTEIQSVRGGGSVTPFANYTAVAPLSQSGTVGWSYNSGTATTDIFTTEGQNKIGPWSISVSGGPGIPDGNKYVLSVNIEEAFTDTNGTKYYEKEIIVATIPTRT